MPASNAAFVHASVCSRPIPPEYVSHDPRATLETSSPLSPSSRRSIMPRIKARPHLPMTRGMASRVLGVLRGQPIAFLALFVALGGSSYAAVSAGKIGQGDVIVGCVAKDGKLRVVASASRCTGKET